jgi:hypothetical protein
VHLPEARAARRASVARPLAAAREPVASAGVEALPAAAVVEPRAQEEAPEQAEPRAPEEAPEQAEPRAQEEAPEQAERRIRADPSR